MGIRLVASDIDGTLLGPSGIPSTRMLHVLRRVREAGVIVALATARRWAGCVPAAAALEMDGPLILYDGALTRSYPSGAVIAYEAMDRDHVAAACAMLAGVGLRPTVQYFDEGGEHLAAPAWRESGDASLGYLKLFAEQVAIKPLDELHSQRGLPLRVVAFRYPEDDVPDWLARRTADLDVQLLSAGSYGPDEITYFRRDTSKGAALRGLAERLHLPLAETLAIGDGANDISMLSVAGIGIAMGQAEPAVKMVATAETLPFASDGAAAALERYVLAGEASGEDTRHTVSVTDDPDEMLDLVDESDEVIGAVRRGDANRNPSLIHRSVEVLVLTSRGTLVMQRRAMSKDLYPGALCASASGHVSAGQSYDEAARKELREELGIVAEVRQIGKCLVRAETETEFTSVYIAHHDGPFAFSPIETDGGIEVPLVKALDSDYRASLGIVPALEAGFSLLAAFTDLAGAYREPQG